MAIFHLGNFGSCGSRLHHDRAGYVATSAREVMRGDWGERPTREWATEVARENREAVREAKRCLREFQWASMKPASW